jgi:hypothetical protein
MRQPEGCMVEGYAMEVSMGFLKKYIQNFWIVIWRVWGAKEEEGIRGEVLEGASSQVDLNPAKWDMTHHYVLMNTTTMVDWVK